MKIAITGLPSTGKTTLSKAIAELAGVPYMEEQPLLDAAYDYCDRNGLVLSTRYIPNFNAEDVMHWQRGFLEAKFKFHADNESYVADGCPLLTIVYVLSTCHSTFSKEEVDKIYLDLVKMARSYDCIYYLPFGVLPIVDDGRRTTNFNYHRMQDLMLHGLFDLLQDHITVVELHETDLQTRIELVAMDLPDKLPLMDLLPLMGLQDSEKA